MDLSSPSFPKSPPPRLQELTQLENKPPHGRTPRQTSVSSASRLPSSPTRHSGPSQLASPRYVKQFHAFMEHQREVHNEERALWHTERADLHEKIAQLEATLRRYQAISSSEVASPIDKTVAGSNGSFWSLLSTDGSRQTSSAGTGDEVWRGTKVDAAPTRTFSDTSYQADKSENRLPSIAENVDRRKPYENAPEEQSKNHKPSIIGSQIDKSLDGINFKPSSFSPRNLKNIMTPQSPSPQSNSPSRVSPSTIEFPPRGLKGPDDHYTKDAGHTPLARRTYSNMDGANSARSSGATTPTQPEIERPPLDPQITSVRLPSERSDSYFPATHDHPGDADLALTGQLGLTNDKGKDKNFLSQLDFKLQQAAESETLEPAAVAGASDISRSAKAPDKEFEQPEHEPKLKIKRSMNFGSAFGDKNLGKRL